MHRKLSHPVPPRISRATRNASTVVTARSDRPGHSAVDSHSARRPRWVSSSSCVVVTLVAAAVGWACGTADDEHMNGDARIPGAAIARHANDPEPREPFEWPRSELHPRLILAIETPHGSGSIEVELMPELAAESVKAIIGIARSGGYDGTTFHRVIPEFMIQGGDPNSRDTDPTNDGRGGAPVEIPDEGRDAPMERGTFALANRGSHGSSSTQFFIMQTDHLALEGRYNVIGRVVRGIELVDLIASAETDRAGRWGPKDRPLENILIRSATVVSPEATR